MMDKLLERLPVYVETRTIPLNGEFSEESLSNRTTMNLQKVFELQIRTPGFP